MDPQPARSGAFIRINCPARACGEEIVARVHEGELAALTRGQVRSYAVRFVFCAMRTDLVFPVAAATGTALLTMFLALWQVLNPSPHDNLRALVGIVAGGAAVIALFTTVIVVDLAVGVRGWRAALPRPLVDVKTMPIDYRT
jgi:hypothetical protein